ncbi:MAG: hypothetical protein RLZZ135_2172 [Cyanobacteriota bacterium]
MNMILHITSSAEWKNAKTLGTYRSDSLADESFIHCSTAAQVIGSANRFFKGRENLVILSIDPDRVSAEIRYEGVESNNLFPHIYGELNIDAVRQVTDLETDADGIFVLPLTPIDRDE